MASVLWNLADISKLRDSSGRDFLICNIKLNIKVGIHFNVTAKKCFVSTALQVKRQEVHKIRHHLSPEGQDIVEGGVEQQLGWDQLTCG